MTGYLLNVKRISASTGDPPCFQATELAKRVAEEAIGGDDPVTLDVP